MGMARECDKCGLLYKPYETRIGHEVMVKINDEDQTKETMFYDLCPKCLSALQGWIAKPSSNNIIQKK